MAVFLKAGQEQDFALYNFDTEITHSFAMMATIDDLCRVFRYSGNKINIGKI